MRLACHYQSINHKICWVFKEASSNTGAVASWKKKQSVHICWMHFSWSHIPIKKKSPNKCVLNDGAVISFEWRRDEWVLNELWWTLTQSHSTITGLIACVWCLGSLSFWTQPVSQRKQKLGGTCALWLWQKTLCSNCKCKIIQIQTSQWQSDRQAFNLHILYMCDTESQFTQKWHMNQV